MRPDIFRELRVEVFPAWQRALESSPSYAKDILRTPWRVIERQALQSHNELRASLQKWGTKWSLVAEWVFDRALWMFWEWAERDEARLETVVPPASDPYWDRERLAWARISEAGNLMVTPAHTTWRLPTQPVPPAWEPFHESELEYRRRANVYLDAYIDVVRAEAQRRGLSQQTARFREDEREHIRWLARYQVGKQTFGSIAGSRHKATSTVEEAIKSIARSIDLKLRPGAKRGPKRGGALRAR